MTRKEAMKLCRYYGKSIEHDGPLIFIFEQCEEIFVKCLVNEEIYNDVVDQYIAYGLADYRKDDGVPILMKALIFWRVSSVYERVDAEMFKNVYAQY